METLYDRFGGMEVVARLVFAFYERVLRSQRLAPYFTKANMPWLINHQVKLLASIMGGPKVYTNAQLHEVHADLHIDDRAFEEMVGLLAQTLRDFGLGEDEVAHVMADVRGRRPYIVSAGE